MLAAVVLAAGAGSRMGGVAKCLITVDGETLLQRLLRAVHTLAPAQTVLVLGHHAQAIQNALRATAAPLPLTVVHNAKPGDSPASSLRLGLLALRPEVNTVMVLLADQPLLEVGDVSAMLRAWRDRAANIDLVVPTHQGQPGHPLVFGASVRQAILQGQGGEGVREWRRAHPERVSLIPMGHARGVTDVDTPDDLQTLADQHGVRLRWPDEADGTD